jgi:hypothetical protein
MTQIAGTLKWRKNSQMLMVKPKTWEMESKNSKTK